MGHPAGARLVSPRWCGQPAAGAGRGRARSRPCPAPRGRRGRGRRRFERSLRPRCKRRRRWPRRRPGGVERRPHVPAFDDRL